MNYRLSTLKTSLSALVAAPLAVSSVFAHPGHGASMMVAPENPTHWLVEPVHLAGWLAVGCVLWALHHWRDQRKQRRQTLARAKQDHTHP